MFIGRVWAAARSPSSPFIVNLGFLDIHVVLKYHFLCFGFLASWMNVMLLFKIITLHSFSSGFPFSIQSRHSRPSRNCAEDVIPKMKTDQVSFAPHLFLSCLLECGGLLLESLPPSNWLLLLSVFFFFYGFSTHHPPPTNRCEVILQRPTGRGGPDEDPVVYK